MQTNFAFPVLTVSEICTALHDETGALIPEEIIKTPEPQSIREIYDIIVKHITGFEKNQDQPEFEELNLAARVFANPELHDDSKREIAFMRDLFKIATVSCLPDFSLKDIVSPDFKRTKVHLSGIVNYLRFRNDRLGKVEELIHNSESMKAQKRAVEEEIDVHKKNLHALMDKREREQPMIDDLTKQNQALVEEINRLNIKQAELRVVGDNCKKQLMETTDNIANQKFLIMKGKQEIAQYKSQIVPAPEKLRAVVEEMKISLENDREAVANNTKRLHELGERYEIISRIEKETSRSLKLLEECEVEMTKSKQAKKILKNLTSTLAENEAALRELDSNELHAQRTLKTWQEKVVRLEKQDAEKRELVSQAMQEALEQKADAEKQRIATAGTIERDQLSKQEIQLKIDLAKKKHQADLLFLNQKYDELEKRVQDYHSGLFKAIKRI